MAQTVTPYMTPATQAVMAQVQPQVTQVQAQKEQTGQDYLWALLGRRLLSNA